MDATTVVAKWHLCNIGFIKLFSSKVVDDYRLWAYVICEKVRLNMLIEANMSQLQSLLINILLENLESNVQHKYFNFWHFIIGSVRAQDNEINLIAD